MSRKGRPGQCSRNRRGETAPPAGSSAHGAAIEQVLRASVPGAQEFVACRRRGQPGGPEQRLAWDQFRTNCEAVLRSCACSCHLHGDEIEICIHAAWVDVVAELPQLGEDPAASICGWLGRLLRRQAKWLVRSRARRGRSLSDLPLQAQPRDPATQLDIEHIADSELVTSAFAELARSASKLEYEVVYRHWIREEPIRQIAASIGRSEDAAWALGRRGFHKLRKIILSLNESYERP